MKLLVVIPFSRSDFTLAENLLEWMEELGRYEDNEALLVRDGKLTELECTKLYATARRVFKAVHSISPPFSLPDERWPIGPNWMFETTLRHFIGLKNPNVPWLWVEPDCVPMRQSWLRDIETTYARAKQPFMGQVVVPGMQGLPERMLSGVAVYPSDAMYLNNLLRVVVQTKTRTAWDVASASVVVPYTHHTRLIYNFHGEKDRPPTFVAKRTHGHPINAMEPKDIPITTSLFHRCKDGSLTGLLRGDGDATIQQLWMAYKLKTTIQSIGKQTIEVREPLRFFHSVEMHEDKDDEATRRVTQAYRSWERIYKTGQMKPAHVWEHDYPRDARSIGDKRCLPFLKDLLIPAMTKARHDDDVIVWTNNDSVLHPKIIEALDAKLQSVDACGSFRVNFDRIERAIFDTDPGILVQRGTLDLGRDLFAFKKKWLKKRWTEIPDFLIGELEFDLVIATLIRRDAGVYTTKLNWDQLVNVCEIERGYLLHAMHERAWVSDAQRNSAAKMWNRDLAVKFYASKGFASLISNF
jgi:hypothetical protein